MFSRKKMPKVKELVEFIPPPDAVGEWLWRNQRSMVAASLIRLPENES